jgi:glycosyltransferase involved in cell wall biosynthesis
LRSSSGEGGGAEKIIFRYILDIDSRGFEPYCAYIYDRRAKSYPVYDQALALGIKAHKILIKSPFSPALIVQIRRLVKKLGINIIHTHGYKSDISSLVAGIGLGIRRVATVHGFISTDTKLKIYNRLDIKALRFFDRVITVNNPQRLFLIKNGISPDRLRVVHNGVDCSEFSRIRIRTDIKKDLEIDGANPVILYLGRLTKEKGLPVLLEAFRRVLQEIPSTRLLVAGSGPLEMEVKEHARLLVIDKAIGFLGFRTDTVDLLGAADVLALSSETEGIPVCVLEAMSMEVPVVATAVGGTPEILENGKEGILVPPGDSRAFAEALLRILKNPEDGRVMGGNGRKRVLKDFSFSNIIHDIEAVYEEMMKEKR